jgi:DNA processing protein
MLQGSGGPGHEDFDSLLNIFYKKGELAKAKRYAEDFLDRQSPPIRFIHLWEGAYPRPLKEIYDPPPVLFYTGSEIPALPGIAIVGTRHPEPISIVAVQKLVREIGMENGGTPIVSGFARGIDRAAHLAAVGNGLPSLAILGSGILHPAPESNLEIVDLARKRGIPFTLLSEFVPDATPMPYHFPRRNRIIAGLCDSLYVMQAPKKSGAMISARFAIDEGREVLAFDHDLLMRTGLNEGARSLICDGAIRLDIHGLRIIYDPPFREPPTSEQLEFWKNRGEGRLVRVGVEQYVERDFFHK